MNITVLASGSTGNAYIVTDGQTSVLLDAGIPFKKLQQKSGFGLSSVDAALISHHHADHSAAVRDLIGKQGMNAHMSEATARTLGVAGYRVKLVAPSRKFEVGTFKIVPFSLPHINSDGTECPNLGYLLFSTVTGERLLFATDCMYIPQRFPACDIYMVEVNYSEDVENDHTIPAVEKRRWLSHMSLNTAMKFYRAQDLSKCKAIYALHLSNARCNENEIRRELEKLGKPVQIC